MTRSLRYAAPVAELARVSNLPTVLTNVLVGALIADARPAPGSLAVALVSVACLYVGGMVLNDVVDADFDREANPRRPIPSGRIGRRAAAGLGGMLLGAGVLAAASASVAAAALAMGLAAAIITYDLVHKRWSHAVWIMGLCRALVYPVAAAIVGADAATHGPFAAPIVPVALIVLAYTVGLTVVARHEHERAARGSASLTPFAPMLAPLALSIAVPNRQGLAPATAVLTIASLVWLWIAARRARSSPARTRDAVTAWIAGFCLLDALVLARLGHTGFAGAAVGLFAAARLAQRRIAGT